MSERACWCTGVEPWSCGAVSRPAEETLARGGVSGFPQVHFDSCEEAGGGSSWRHSWLRPLGGTPAPGTAQRAPAAPGARGLLGEAGAAWGLRDLMKHLMCITAGQGETRTPPPQRVRHFSSPARDFPTSCPPPPPATGQKGAARAGCGVASGGLARVMLSPRWRRWGGGGGGKEGSARPRSPGRDCTQVPRPLSQPPQVMDLTQISSELAGYKIPGGEKGCVCGGFPRKSVQ